MLKKIAIFLVILIALAAISFIFFKHHFLKIEAHIEPTQDSYKYGDKISIETTITNYAPWPYKTSVLSTHPGPHIEVESVSFSPTVGVISTGATTDVIINPFGSITYSTPLTLVAKDLGTKSIGKDLVVRPGPNIIKITWAKSTMVALTVK